MPVNTIKLSEILANSGKLVTVFAKVLANPEENKYLIGDESAVKLLIVDPTFKNSESLVIGKTVKIFKSRIENEKDVLIADETTFIFGTSKEIIVQEGSEEHLNLPKEQVHIINMIDLGIRILLSLDFIELIFKSLLG